MGMIHLHRVGENASPEKVAQDLPAEWPADGVTAKEGTEVVSVSAGAESAGAASGAERSAPGEEVVSAAPQRELPLYAPEALTLETKAGENVPRILFEDERRREANVKHYRLSDGTYLAAVYDEPVHYFDEQAQAFREIRDDFVAVEDGLETQKAGFRAKASLHALDGRVMTLTKGDARVEWSFLPAQPAENSAARVKPKAAASAEGFAAVPTGSEVVYEDVEPDVDLEYAVTAAKIKENIIVRSRRESYRFCFRLHCAGLSLRMSPEGDCIELCADKDGETRVEFTIPSPYMYDADGAESESVFYEVEPDEDGYRFQIIADADWINDAQRAFPVTIDPQIIANTSALIQSATVIPGVSKNCTGSYRKVGYDNYCRNQRTYFRIAKPLIDGDSNILSAKLVLTQHSYYSCDGSAWGFEVKKTVSSIDPYTMSVSSLPALESGTLDFIPRPKSNQYSSSSASSESQWHYLDLTEAMNEQFAKKSDLCFVIQGFTGDAKNCNNYLEFWSERTANKPTLFINYASKNVYNDNQSYENVEMGGAGTGYVNLYTGNLLYAHSDVAVEGEKLPVNISHVYNGYFSGDHNITNVDDIVFNDYHVGYGWKLNMQQYIKKLNSSNYSVDGDVILYVDGMGSEHYFINKYYYYDYGGKYYVDKRYVYSDIFGYYTYRGSCCKRVYTEMTDDSGLNMEFHGTVENTCYFKDNKDNYLYFKDGRLVELTNQYGLSVHIEYQSNKIVVSDGANRKTQLNFTSGKLTSIQSPDHRITTFGYDAANANLLSTITYPDGTATRFTYQVNDKLSKVTADDGSSAAFAYDSVAPNKVTRISYASRLTKVDNGGMVLATAETPISTTNVTYRTNKSTCVQVDNGERLVYVFDQVGRVITQYVDEKANSAAGINVKNGAVYNYSNYKRSFEADTTGLKENLLVNPSFETKTNATWADGWTTSASLNSANDYRTATGYAAGSYAFRIKGEPTKEKYLGQVLANTNGRLNKNNFILSGWAKADSCEINPNDSDYYHARRKFELRAEVSYATGASETYRAYFDCQCKDWQFAAVPIRRRSNAVISSILVKIVYSYNVNEALFDNIYLSEGTGVYTEFSDDGKLISKDDGYFLTKNTMATEDKNNEYQVGDLIRSEMVDKTDGSKTYVTEYKYSVT